MRGVLGDIQRRERPVYHLPREWNAPMTMRDTLDCPSHRLGRAGWYLAWRLFLIIPILPLAETAPAATDDAGNPAQASIQLSEEAGTLLRRAEAAIERGDFKLAVDSLQRMIDLPGDHVLIRDESTYESARRHAHRRIASLPPEGREAYRRLFDAEASALTARARADHDMDLLRTVVSTYFASSVGDEASVMLADWLIDEGRWSEAMRVLEDLRALYPDSDLPAWVVPARMATCAALSGQSARAEALITKLETLDDKNHPQVRRRIDLLHAHMAKPRTSDIEGNLRRWPMYGGDVTRNVRQPIVVPTLRKHTPWSVSPPLTDAPWKIAELQRYARSRQLFPTRQVVTDGQVLVVKGPTELMALDADSFSVRWVSRTPRAKHASQESMSPNAWPMQHAQPGAKVNPLDRDPLAHLLLYDTVSAQVTLSDGLALSVQWPGDPPIPLATLRYDPIPWRAGEETDRPWNEVVAYSLEDGRVQWRSDMTRLTPTRTEDGRQAGVEFLSAPIPALGQLLAVCRVNTDLYAVLLDTATGECVRDLYLCGTGGGWFRSLYALTPCIADRVAYIPTGRGLMVAVDLEDWSTRWAIRYPSRGYNAVLEGWLSCPLVASGDVVLMAPGDGAELLCIERSDGTIRWRMERNRYGYDPWSHSYMMGATDRHVFICGREVWRVSLATGDVVWRQACGDPVGRGTLSGDRVYVPTTGGLVAMDADSGERIDVEQPVGMEPLGNLLAWNGTLYSVELGQVRRFPDLDRGYRLALERHRAAPSDTSAAIRLAWLEMQQHAPHLAVAALETVPDKLREQSPQKHAQVVHLRVNALLEWAVTLNDDPEQARILLTRAREAAIAPDDRLRAGLALGDHLRREERYLDACRQYLDLTLSREGDAFVGLQDGLEVRARLVAERRLADALRQLDDDARRRLQIEAAGKLDEHVANGAQSEIQRIARSSVVGEPSWRARLWCAARAVQSYNFEQAEQTLREVLRDSTSAELTAEAAARLAALYLESGELHQPVAAQALLDRLTSEPAAVFLPEDILSVGLASDRPGTEPSDSFATISAPDLAARLRERLDEGKLQHYTEAIEPPCLGAIRKETVETGEPGRPITVRGPRREPFAGQLLTLRRGPRIESVNLAGQEMIWEANPRLEGQAAVDIETERGRSLQRGSGGPLTAEAAHAVVDGQTLVINLDAGLHAIGVLSGKALWSRRFDPPCDASHDPDASDNWLWAHDGHVISVDSQNRLVAARIDDGQHEVWRRSTMTHRWKFVRARGSYVAAADDGLAAVDIFRLDDGLHLGQCRFEQPMNAPKAVAISLYDEVICGPVSNRGVAGLELAIPGTERWRIEMPDTLRWMFKPTPDLLAIGDRSGHLKIIDPSTGQTRLDKALYSCTLDAALGAMVDNVLYLYGNPMVDPAAPASNQNRRVCLIAIDMEQGETLWEKSPDLDHNDVFLSPELLIACRNAIPLAVRKPYTGGDIPRREALAFESNVLEPWAVELTLIDKATGVTIGEPAEARVPEGGGANRILDVQVWPGEVVVRTGDHTVRFEADVLPPGELQGESNP